MASFLGSGTGYPAGGTMAVLARNVQVNPGTTAAVALCSPGETYVPLYVVIRAGATAWSSSTSFALGITGALSSLVSTKVVTSLPSTQNYLLSLFTSGSTTAAPAVAAAGTTVYFNAVQVDPTATVSFVDLIGYVY